MYERFFEPVLKESQTAFEDYWGEKVLTDEQFEIIALRILITALVFKTHPAFLFDVLAEIMRGK